MIAFDHSVSNFQVLAKIDKLPRFFSALVVAFMFQLDVNNLFVEDHRDAANLTEQTQSLSVSDDGREFAHEVLSRLRQEFPDLSRLLEIDLYEEWLLKEESELSLLGEIDIQLRREGGRSNVGEVLLYAEVIVREVRSDQDWEKYLKHLEEIDSMRPMIGEL